LGINTLKTQNKKVKKILVVKIKQFLLVIDRWDLKTRKTRTNRLTKHHGGYNKTVFSGYLPLSFKNP